MVERDKGNGVPVIEAKGDDFASATTGFRALLEASKPRSFQTEPEAIDPADLRAAGTDALVERMMSYANGSIVQSSVKPGAEPAAYDALNRLCNGAYPLPLAHQRESVSVIGKDGSVRIEGGRAAVNTYFSEN